MDFSADFLIFNFYFVSSGEKNSTKKSKKNKKKKQIRPFVCPFVHPGGPILPLKKQRPVPPQKTLRETSTDERTHGRTQALSSSSVKSQTNNKMPALACTSSSSS
jgi:hypothetical protein